MDDDKEAVYSTHCAECGNANNYLEGEYVPESCPACGEHKEFTILHLEADGESEL